MYIAIAIILDNAIAGPASWPNKYNYETTAEILFILFMLKGLGLALIFLKNFMYNGRLATQATTAIALLSKRQSFFSNVFIHWQHCKAQKASKTLQNTPHHYNYIYNHIDSRCSQTERKLYRYRSTFIANQFTPTNPIRF